jgi:hypothetical protein
MSEEVFAFHQCVVAIDSEDGVSYTIKYVHQVRAGKCIVCDKIIPAVFHYDPQALENLLQ